MSPLSLPPQTLAWLNHAADAGQRDAQALLHLIARADKHDQDVAIFVDSYSKTIAALCRRLDALEALRKGGPEPAAPTPSPTAPVGGLVERVANAMGPSTQAAMDAGELPFGNAWAAIREIADWLDTQGHHASANVVRWGIDG
jgi:hypothetical protein